jgi:hypothetical protein
MMLIVQLWGGLGNQMFQYAFARGAARKMGEKFCLDTTFFANQDTSWHCCIRGYELERIFGIHPEHVDGDSLSKYKKNARFSWAVGRYTKIPFLNGST